MLKTFLILACVAGYITIISCDGEAEPAGEIVPVGVAPIEETVPDGSSPNRTRECGCSPPICRKNEVYYNCSGGCIPRRCSEIGFPLDCDKKCTPGCVCKGNYVRADNGTCIPIPDCPSCGGDKNAEQGCGNNCGRTCSTYNNPPIRCPIGCIFNGCKCRKGYVYDPNVKACVKPEDCTPICKVNEQYSSCINGGCEAKNCSQLGKPVPCIKIDPKYCIKGCICVEGYLRAPNGTCVPKDQCKGCGDDPNAHTGCGVNCGRTCSTYKTKYVACILVCKLNGCDCNDGYVFDPNVNKCVLPKHCTPTCGLNEVYSSCTNGGCGHRNCSQLGQPELCINRTPESCTKGCICASGYLRADNGTCVPRDKCPAVGCGGDPNAEPGCGYNCGKTCSTYKVKHPICPRIVCKPNRCDCKKGYVYDSNVKKCVLPKDCTPICKLNEEYSSCVNGGCEARNCSQIGKPVPCIKIDPKYCIKGCVCVKGYLRNSKGICVPKKECTPPICKVNEQYSSCINGGCEAKNCSQIGKPVPCIKIDPKYCIKGCVCVKGYLRNSKGICVPKKECTPKCDKPNEVYDVCPAPCPPRRCNVNEAVIKCAPPPKPGHPDCVPGCRCADKYYRNATGTCVPKRKCEKPLICDRPNEVYNPCGITCPPQECGVDPALVRCLIPNPQYGDPNCNPSCVCIDGCVRNDANECIPRDKCPQNCPKNEEYSICINGGCEARNCSQVDKPVPCVRLDPKSCIKGCVCVKGYLRAPNGICVPKNRCTSTCGKNEHYEECYYSCGGNQTCDDIGKKYSCPAQQKCYSGCRCDKGYWRNADNVCIPEKQCPRCYGKNEVWVNCIQGCSNQSCDDIGKIFHCPNQPAGQCKSGCRCEPGTWRNASNVCVWQEECPKPECPNDEVWSWCPAIPCDGDYCPKTRDSPQTCPFGIVCDKPRCVCAGNRKRDWKTGKCIRIQDCPKFKCECNEEYQACPLPCPGETCSDYFNGLGLCPPYKPICRPQCRCIKDYYRDANGNCVPARDCPKISITTTEPPTTTGGTTGGGIGLTGILDGITAFTGLCLYNRMKSEPSENIIMSAMSVFTPVAQLCLYTEGPAYDQCIKLLNLKDKQDIRDTFPKLDAALGGQTTVNFSMVSKFYSDEKYKLSDSFKHDAVDVFNASAEELDFSKNQLAADIINAWVESKTNNRITDLVTKDMFSQLTRLVLVNAIYFKGTWLYEFNKNNTKEENFYLNDGTTKKTQMMGQEIKDLDYGEIPSLDCRAVRVYYKGKTSSMIIVLPNTKNGTLDLAKNLQDPTNWKKVIDSFSPQKVKLYLPLFKITTTTDLKDLLKKANIIDWFNSENSGLEGILSKHEVIYVTEAIQKAFVEVNEQGAEAAAANAVVVSTRSLPLPPPVILEFKANRAFLYYLEVGSIVALCGAFNG